MKTSLLQRTVRWIVWLLSLWHKCKRNVTLIMLGLDNAGKSATVQGIQGEDPQDVTPTVGFTRIEMKQDKFQVTIFDLGGGKRIRDIWKNYYTMSHGVVFVVDSTDIDRIHETRETLAEVLGHPCISGKPVLVLANKQDKQEALYESDITERLSLEQLVNKYKCRCNIVPCSALRSYGKMADKSIKKGLKWLLNTINLDYEIIAERVLKDTAEQQAQEERYKKERAERVRLIREEREREEREMAEREGRQILEEDCDEENIQSPFQPISNVISVYDSKEKMNMMKDTAYQLSQKERQQDELEMAECESKHGPEDHNDESPFQPISTETSVRMNKDTVQENSSTRTDADQESYDNDGEATHRRKTPEDSHSGKQDVKNVRSLFLKRKHRVEPLNTGDGPAMSESSPPEFYKKPLPPLVSRPKPNGETHDVIT
ncbi:ADP-ribosylation factor-like protein 13B isoform X2 [Takifugu flavidus]|uniref:ADP-ribosylation factor-like protein 13B isoform X2 n=1 Tax=Takifugu flavidus TaxID=433684 RepID=UPI00254442E8|nr:ADP-ribosylation factor-like protein 13B isoform X2 [Takifugu flavidus]